MTDDAAPGEASPRSGSDLFGRGMIYVLVWSMQLLVGTIVSPVLAHVLAKGEFGALAAAIALYQLLLLLSVFGIDQALEVQRVQDGADAAPARGLLASGSAFALALTAVLALTAIWWAPALGFDGHLDLVLVTLCWTAPGAVVMLTLSMLQAEDRLLRFAVVSVIATVGSQLCGLALLFAVHRDAVTYSLGGVIGQSAAVVLGMSWARPRLRGLVDHRLTRRALRLGVPLVLAGLSDYVLTASDRLIVQRWFGVDDVAQYQVGFVIGNAVTLMLLFTNRAWLPRLAGIADPESRWRLVAASRDGIYLLLGWALLGVTVAAPALLRVWVPDSYDRPAITTLVYVVGLSALPVAAMGATQRMLITIRWSTPMAWSSAIAVGVKLVSTLVLLGVVGLPGAALGTLLGLGAQAFYLRRRLAVRHRPIRSSARALAFLGVSVSLAGGSVLLPQDLTWDVGRLVIALVCLVPFVRALRRLQRTPSPGALPESPDASEAATPTSPPGGRRHD